MNRQTAYVRELARQIAEIAASPENEQVKRRWRNVNALRKPDRPPVYCRPVGAWTELLPEESLICTDGWMRQIERGFKMALVKHDIDDDTPLEPDFPVSAVFDCDPPNTWGVDVQTQSSGVEGGSWTYDPPLKNAEDFDNLRIPHFTYNETKTHMALWKAHDLLGDILPVKLCCGPLLGTNLISAAANLRGLSQIMMDMADRPDLMHRLMSFLRDATLDSIRQVEETGLLSPNNNGPMYASDPIGEDSPDGKLTCLNLWAGADGQEFDQVSPAMWREFCLDYQMAILERFGLVSYGCCENLTNKMDGVLSIPNLRIFVCSAWTDLDKVVDRVGGNYAIMWRQKASEVVFPDDTAAIEHHLDDGLRKLKGGYVQVVLRELQTLAGHPDRLHVWTRLAKDAAAKYA